LARSSWPPGAIDRVAPAVRGPLGRFAFSNEAQPRGRSRCACRATPSTRRSARSRSGGGKSLCTRSSPNQEHGCPFEKVPISPVGANRKDCSMTDRCLGEFRTRQFDRGRVKREC
jgi:hypothetical protein